MFSNAHIASPSPASAPPMHGAKNPGNTPGVTTPGHALAPDIGGPPCSPAPTPEQVLN